jgi:hypothetical protein
MCEVLFLVSLKLRIECLSPWPFLKYGLAHLNSGRRTCVQTLFRDIFKSKQRWFRTACTFLILQHGVGLSHGIA